MSEPRRLSAIDCASTAWTLLWKAPGAHFVAGFLLLFMCSVFPVLGAVFPLRAAQTIFLAAGSWIAGMLWIGMSDMALTALAGREVQLAQLFVAFTGPRQKTALVYGGLVALLMVVAALLATPFSIDMQSFSRTQLTPSNVQGVLLYSMISLFIQLLPLVIMAAYFFPAGFYIARGEENCFTALKKGSAAIRSVPGFWTFFWVVMTVGHAAGAMACCVGLCWAIAWNCIAMGSAMISLDPGLRAVEPPAL